MWNNMLQSKLIFILERAAGVRCAIITQNDGVWQTEANFKPSW